MKRIKKRVVRMKRAKRWKWLITVVIGIALLFQLRGVEAGMNDAYLQRMRIDGYYAVAHMADRDHLYYLDLYRVNGRISYCIELGAKVTTDIYHSSQDFVVSNFSQEQMEYVQSISYFGYGYRDHLDYGYYMAAQELIWEYLSGIEVEWTNVLDVNGDRIDLSSFKNEILRLVDIFNRDIWFNWDKGDYEAGEIVTYSDRQNVLSYYEVEYAGRQKVTIQGNELTIEVNPNYVGYDDIVLRFHEDYPYRSEFYYYDGSQKLVSNGVFLDKTKEIYLNVHGFTMNVYLVDADSGVNIPSGQASLEGASYEVYNENMELVTTFSTDSLGNAILNELVYGTYYIKQIEASLGYQLNDELVLVEFSKDNTSCVLTEQVIYQEFEFMKVYGSLDEGYFCEEGVNFSIYFDDGDFYQTVSTDVKGHVSFRLPYGHYKVVQDNTTAGYHKVDDFELVVDKQLDYTIFYTLSDDKIMAHLSIATWDITNDIAIHEEGIVYQIKNVQTDQYLEYEGSDEFVTDSEGVVVVPIAIGYGEYEIIQKVGPEGYLEKAEPLMFVFDENTYFELKDQELHVGTIYYNEMLWGRIEVLTNEEVYQPVSNGFQYDLENRESVLLQLYANEDIIFHGDIIYNKGEVVWDGYTDQDGKTTIENVYLGSYCILDVENNLEECFSFDTDLALDGEVVWNAVLTLGMNKTHITLENVDEFGDKIGGSVFELYDSSQNLIYTGLTNEEGVILIGDLSPGEYCFSQVKVPDGYIIHDKSCFEIDGSLTEMKHIISNKRVHNSVIQVPNTLKNTAFLVGLVGGIFVLLGGIWYQKKSRGMFSR